MPIDAELNICIDVVNHLLSSYSSTALYCIRTCSPSQSQFAASSIADHCRFRWPRLLRREADCLVVNVAARVRDQFVWSARTLPCGIGRQGVEWCKQWNDGDGWSNDEMSPVGRWLTGWWRGAVAAAAAGKEKDYTINISLITTKKQSDRLTDWQISSVAKKNRFRLQNNFGKLSDISTRRRKKKNMKSRNRTFVWLVLLYRVDKSMSLEWWKRIAMSVYREIKSFGS